uniref:receptor-transporting protein 3 n=1 Tax=Myodes glareolus TaxID=447135 RepID=UPI002022133B|nr:receptor-transporting protein 3 [Myodes glareolus]XP_048279755.1 receptor-transporting protein 3 [Myodes glareolus]XP_048279756.1 receptor-transporting protein 3 [Myodes glareolus]XP_048279757.1 receptor-transporting protein 3 [Myodes glareolus]XP_048279758.1 receptor-transporting protein 3 [Myodes glareolus]XP_048279759.1 receptor-transporting protein 3 [Myodes glareolus]XP_048279760.1 receptor-transporting protein 3 [Myodes glareolus]
MMEEDIEVWQQVFQELIQEVKPWDKWTLTPDKDLLPGVLKPGWTQYQQKTFARFLCPSCSRSWASACVLVIFHMRWCKKRGKGRVKMRIFAQRCNKCPEPPFAAPEFAWDNISRILSNLVFRILKKCYGEGFKEMAEIPVLGDTGLEGPHDSNNCEACLQGFCVQSSSGLASKPPACPLSPTSSKSTREPTVAVTCSNVSCSQPSSKMEKPQASKVDTKASNPTKADPKVSHTPNPSTVPILTTQQLAPVSSPAPRCAVQMPSPAKSSRTEGMGNKNSRSKIPEVLPWSSAFVPTVSSSFILPTTSSYAPPTSLFVPSTSSSYVAPTSSKVEKPQALKGDAKASNPTKADPKVSHTPNPSTVPILTTQELTPVSSPAPRCAIQMPSPAKSSRTEGTGNKNSRSKIPEVLPRSSAFVPTISSSFILPTSSSYVPPTPAYVVPSSGRPGVNITYQAERSSHIHPAGEPCCCQACCGACHECCSKSCECCCGCFCACCQGFCDCMKHNPFRRLVFLIFAAVVVTLFIKYGF